jgi:hypothetical protein
MLVLVTVVVTTELLPTFNDSVVPEMENATYTRDPVDKTAPFSTVAVPLLSHRTACTFDELATNANPVVVPLAGRQPMMQRALESIVLGFTNASTV